MHAKACMFATFLKFSRRKLVSPAMSNKPRRIKWTEQMNNDVLECKRQAKELISSQNPPRNENGKKKGYIEVMKQL